MEQSDNGKDSAPIEHKLNVHPTHAMFVVPETVNVILICTTCHCCACHFKIALGMPCEGSVRWTVDD